MTSILVKNYYSNKQDFTIHHNYNEIMNEEAKNLARNLTLLMDHYDHTQMFIEEKTGVSQKTVSNMKNPGDDYSPGLNNVSAIARFYNLQTWHLLLPNPPEEILFNSSIEKFVDHYMVMSKEEREAWAHVAEVSAKYHKTG